MNAGDKKQVKFRLSPGDHERLWRYITHRYPVGTYGKLSSIVWDCINQVLTAFEREISELDHTHTSSPQPAFGRFGPSPAQVLSPQPQPIKTKSSPAAAIINREKSKDTLASVKFEESKDLNGKILNDFLSDPENKKQMSVDGMVEKHNLVRSIIKFSGVGDKRSIAARLNSLIAYNFIDECNRVKGMAKIYRFNLDDKKSKEEKATAERKIADEEFNKVLDGYSVVEAAKPSVDTVTANTTKETEAEKKQT